MKTFVVGVPNITFENCQTKDKVCLKTLVSYHKFDDEIEVACAFLIDEEFETIVNWLKQENLVKVYIEFEKYQAELEDIECHRYGGYTETYYLTSISKPYVSNGGCEQSSEIKLEFGVKKKLWFD